uniref:Uncharacterized protein n=1 Tax=Arundo donax TaxID=35708 RepID=A0A0A9BEE1_ARUDO
MFQYARYLCSFLGLRNSAKTWRVPRAKTAMPMFR